MEHNNNTPETIARKKRKLILKDKKNNMSAANKENAIGGPSTPSTRLRSMSPLHTITPLSDIVNTLNPPPASTPFQLSAPNKKRRFETSTGINLFSSFNSREVTSQTVHVASSSTHNPSGVTMGNQGLTRRWPLHTPPDTPVYSESLSPNYNSSSLDNINSADSTMSYGIHGPPNFNPDNSVASTSTNNILIPPTNSSVPTTNISRRLRRNVCRVPQTPLTHAHSSNMYHHIASDSSSSENSDDSDSEYGPDCSSGSDDEPLDHPQDDNLQEYSDVGNPVWQCAHCKSCMWYQERKGRHRQTTVPKFHICCRSGKVVLPLMKQPPPLLHKLLFDRNSQHSKNFQESIRTYNAMFSFTSPGMKFDTSLNNGGGPPTLRLHGQTCHRIGTMLPEVGGQPQYAQLYIFDTDNEVDNRIKCFRENTNIQRDIVANLKHMLDEHNVHAKAFRSARDVLKGNPFQDLKLRLISSRPSDGRVYNMPTVSEVAALIVGDIDSAETRDIIIHERGGGLQRIDEFHPAYLAYQYPLIFVYGEDGYRDDILHKYKHETEQTKKNRQSIKDWLCFRLQDRTGEPKTLLHSRRLFQQFLVDGYAMMESERLNWLRKNQSKLRVGKYNNLQQQPDAGASTGSTKQGKRVVLPSTFVGSKRYMDQLYFDGMAISSKLGFPDLFITFTCNPNWPEIKRQLTPVNLNPQDRPDVVAKVFKIKFDELLRDVTKKHVLGRVLAYMYTIEFQKRGLPHAHILIFLHPQSKYPTPADIDRIICAEIPDPKRHPTLYNLVKSHMVHGPCGLARQTSRCMKNGKCTKFFPKKFIENSVVDSDGYPLYRRRSSTHIILKNGIPLDNRHVVPYNKKLLLKYQAHINMEWCNQSTSIKYLFKYIHKGHDRITASVVHNSGTHTNNHEPVDEIKQYLDCRYVSPCEASWRIFSYSIHGRKPAVERMFFHLIGEKSVYYPDHARMENVLEKASVTESMFSSWLVANQTYEMARQLTYGQFVTKFVYHKRMRMWKPRKKGYTIGRLIWVPPTTGELFYLRMMLTVVKGPTSYEDIRKVGDIQCDTFRDACFAMGFLEDDKEYIGAIREASEWGSGHYLRRLFVVMLLSGDVNRPAHVWEQTWLLLSDGILHDQRIRLGHRELSLNEAQLKNFTLIEIEILLQKSGRTLEKFYPIPYPDGYERDQLGNRLIYEERSYDLETMKEDFVRLHGELTDEQRGIYDKIMSAVTNQNGGVFFLHGYGGTGKTYMWRTLASAIRSKHDICIAVATSGIASLLLPGGRTAHSRFKIPVPTLDNSTCNITYQEDSADLLREAKLIIWDEAPMANKWCFEALDRTLRDIMSSYGNSDKVFGGKVIVFGGDFRQILPVIPRGSRSDIVHATINASYIWHSVEVLTLTKNMRLTSGPTEQDRTEMADFSDWLLKIGEGRIGGPNDGTADISFPPEMLITEFEDPIVAIVTSTYPEFLLHFHDYNYLKNRAILASTIEMVDIINDHVLGMMPGDLRDYFSSNSVDRSEIHDRDMLDVLSPEFLSSLKTSGLPNHHIKLKVGTPIMLMRNIDQSEGLCNGTRLIVTKLATHVLEARIMGGKKHGNIVYIPRMNMSPSQSPWPFKLSRRQFPIIVSYAMTINKSQGQSLDWVGLYIPRDVFTHGQIYVALSRVTSKKGIKVLIHDETKKPKETTTNVVYKEVFNNV